MSASHAVDDFGRLDAVQQGGIGGTYGGNPVSCAASLAAVNTMESDDLAARAARIGKVVQDTLSAIIAAAREGNRDQRTMSPHDGESL